MQSQSGIFSLRTRGLALYLLLLATLFKGIVWAVVTPIFQGPDENRHYAYAAYIAEFKRLPPQDVLFVSDEVKEVYGAVEFGKTIHTGMKQNFIHGTAGKFEQDVRKLTIADRTQGELAKQIFGNAQVYPPLYYVMGAFIYKIFYSFSFIERFYAMRIIFLMLSVVTVYFSYLLAFEFFRKTLPSLAVATAVSFLPQYSFLGAVLNNDNLLIALIVIFLYLGLRSVNYGLNTQRALLLGIVGALACLVKYQAVVIVAAGTIVLLYQSLASIKPHRQVIKYASIIFLTVFLISGWWYLRNYFYYGSFFGVDVESFQSISTSEHPGIVQMIGWTLLYLFMLVTDFLGEFGWADIFLSDAYYVFFALLLAAALAGLAYVGLTQKIALEQKPKLIFLLACLLSLVSLMLFLFLSTLYKTGFAGRFNQARSFFALLPVIFIIFLWPIEFFKSVKQRKLAYIFVAFYFIAVNFLSLYNYMIFGYYV